MCVTHTSSLASGVELQAISEVLKLPGLAGALDPRNVAYEQAGRGNNWAFGRQHLMSGATLSIAEQPYLSLSIVTLSSPLTIVMYYTQCCVPLCALARFHKCLTFRCLSAVCSSSSGAVCSSSSGA